MPPNKQQQHVDSPKSGLRKPAATNVAHTGARSGEQDGAPADTSSQGLTDALTAPHVGSNGAQSAESHVKSGGARSHSPRSAQHSAQDVVQQGGQTVTPPSARVHHVGKRVPKSLPKSQPEDLFPNPPK